MMNYNNVCGFFEVLSIESIDADILPAQNFSTSHSICKMIRNSIKKQSEHIVEIVSNKITHFK
jgi:hypothetical protein